MAAQKGDYIGFTYNGTHSSKLGIVRTSDGSRFNTNLLPTMQDKVVQVPGRDGGYYFGSQYTQRQFNVSFAFDSLTEKQLCNLKKHFGDKQIHDLIFDEEPYKVYSAKVTGTATFNHIPFSDQAGDRIYKGEGSIQFTCYYPFARCWSNTKSSYNEHPAYSGLSESEIEDRIKEWWDASRIDIDGNHGDVPVYFTIKTTASTGSVTVDGKTIAWTNADIGVTLNTKTGLALKDNYVYNNKFTGDLVLKIPVGKAPSATGATVSYVCEYF